MTKTVVSIVAAMAVALIAAFVARGIFQNSANDLLEERQQIDTRLQALATITPGYGTGPLDCMFTVTESETNGWIELSWAEPREVDEVIVVPSLLGRWINTGVRSQGFPRSLEVMVGGDELMQVGVRSLSQEEAILPAPQVFSFTKRSAKRVRIHVSDLVVRPSDNVSVCHLAEVLIFGDGRNVAKEATVTFSQNLRPEGDRQRHLIDGHLPYGMVGPGNGTQVYRRYVEPGQSVALDVKLTDAIVPARVLIYPAGRSITVPWRYPPGTGFPQLVRMHAADRADFQGATLLAEQSFASLMSSHPVELELNPVQTPRSFFRFEFEARGVAPGRPLISLAEIEIYDQDGSIVKGATVVRTSPQHSEKNRPSNLFDGQNRFGQIVPVQKWLGQLAERQALEGRLVEIETASGKLHERNGRVFHFVLVGFVCLGALGGLLYAYQVTRLKAHALESQELLLAELHDEIGASLHAIRMFAEIADSNPDADQKKIVGKIRDLAAETAESVRRVTHLLDEGLTGDAFIQELNQYAKWLPAKVEVKLNLDIGERALDQVPPSDLGHLLRFFHECLANVTRHGGGVTHIEIAFTADGNRMMLEVEDDGEGLDKPNEVPHSLLRRGKLARGRVSASSGSGGSGTRIRIVLTRTPSWWRF